MSRSFSRTLFAATATIALLAFAGFGAGCASDRNSGVPELDTGRGTGDAGTTPPRRDTGNTHPQGYPHLEFVSSQYQGLSSGARTMLNVRYVGADDQPIEDARLIFKYDETRAANTQLRALSAITDEDGIGGVEIWAGTVVAEFEVEVSVGDPEVAPIEFIITVVPKERGDYIIQVLYPDGAVRLQKADIMVFNGRGNCSTVPRSPEEIAGAFDTFQMFPLADGTFSEVGYPTSVADPIREYFPITYAVAIAYKEDIPVAMGCVDGLPTEILPGSNTPIDIILNDIYPSIQGEFRITTEFDFYEFMPPTVETVLRYIGSFFTSPGRTIFNILRDTDVLDIYDFPFGLGDMLVDVLDGLIFTFLPPEVLRVFETGADIDNTLQHLQFQGHMIFFDDPDERGRLAACNKLVFDELVIDFDTIAMPALNMERYGYRAATGNFTGWISVEDSGRNLGYVLNIEPFGLAINYGDLTLFILEAVVFPMMLGPEVDSMEAFIGSFFDCEFIADEIGWAPFRTLCDSAITALVSGIRGYMTSLTTDVSSFYQLSTPIAGTRPPAGVELLDGGMAWGPCPLKLNSDGSIQRVQELGGASPRDNCVWDAKIRYNESDPTGHPVSSAFHAYRNSTRVTGTCP